MKVNAMLSIIPIGVGGAAGGTNDVHCDHNAVLEALVSCMRCLIIVQLSLALSLGSTFADGPAYLVKDIRTVTGPTQ